MLWEFEKEEDKILGVVGHSYGEEPINIMDKIEKHKLQIAETIKKAVAFRPGQVGMEIGPGYGWMTREFAKSCRVFFAVDVSEAYLSKARELCADLPDITFKKIKHIDFSFVDKKVDFIYSNNVFIHLNPFEVYLMIQESAKILARGGRIWFDVVDMDSTNFADCEYFENGLNVYRKALTYQPECVQFISGETVKRMVGSISGLKVVAVSKHGLSTVFLLEKS